MGVNKNTIPDHQAGSHAQTFTLPFSKSIAVMPFTNMSNDPDQEYFNEGMAEEIINFISHLQDLKVASRTSSFQTGKWMIFLPFRMRLHWLLQKN